MSINIACSVPECTNPVIGQCTGYKKSCGKYYCREHSFDTLCAECTHRKSEDKRALEIYQDYSNTAKQIENNVAPRYWSAFLGNKTLHKWWKFTFVGILIALPAAYIADTSKPGGLQTVFIWIMSIGLALCFVSMIGLWIFSATNNRNKWIYEQSKILAIEAEKSKPGFQEFYIAWRKEKNQEQLMKVLAVIGVIASIGIAAASESDYDRVRRAVRDEMKRN